MYEFNPYCIDRTSISFLQRVILIHSFLYYEEDFPIVSDMWYDNISKQLFEEQSKKERRWIKQETDYGYVFYDYDGTTGFDLYDRLRRKDKEYISKIALSLKKGIACYEAC